MENIFTLDKFDDFTEKINIDELYDTKKNRDINTLNLFQKILNRVHSRIKSASKQRNSLNSCWYVVPELMIGVPRFDQAGCIAYLLDKLKINHFKVEYIHPNTLFISWAHWIPSYIRTEFKKKTGQTINEFGEIIDNNNEMNVYGNGNKEESKLLLFTNEKKTLSTKDFTPIEKYKPTGNFK
jgi:hypothetical protein